MTGTQFPESWKPQTLLTVLTGSRAYGLDNEGSDTDYRTVYVQPTKVLVSFGEPHGYDEKLSSDHDAWELLKFVQLSKDCNTTMLECLLAPVVESRPEGLELRKLFPHFLRRTRLYHAFRGCAKNNMERMLSQKPEDTLYRRQKAGAHYLRNLYNGIEVLTEGMFTLRISDTEFGPTVKAAKNGDLTFEEVLAIAADLETKITAACDSSKLPDDCNLGPINAFMREVRKTYW